MEVSYSILEGHLSQIYAVAFLLDGQLLTSTLGNKVVGIWNIKAREAIHDLFFSSNELYLEISGGLLKLKYFSLYINCPDSKSLYSIYVKEYWVVWEGMKILWLPPDYYKTK